MFDVNTPAGIEALAQFLRSGSFDSKYLTDYGNLLLSKEVPIEAKQQYAKRIVKMIKYLPELIGAEVILSD